MTAGWNLTATRWETIVDEISTEYKIPILFDLPALEGAGQGPNHPVTVNLRGMSLRAALTHLLRSHHLAAIIQDEVLLITTIPEAEQHPLLCIYDVHDLTTGTNHFLDTPGLIDTIISCVRPNTWTVNGGTGDIRAPQAGLLTISQTEAAQDEVADMLRALQQFAQDLPAAAATVPAARADNLVTRAYLLQLDKPADEASRKELRDLIARLVPDTSWNTTLPSGEKVVLSVLPDRIVVRNRDEMQRQVAAALNDIGFRARLGKPSRVAKRAQPAPANGAAMLATAAVSFSLGADNKRPDGSRGMLLLPNSQ